MGTKALSLDRKKIQKRWDKAAGVKPKPKKRRKPDPRFGSLETRAKANISDARHAEIMKMARERGLQKANEFLVKLPLRQAEFVINYLAGPPGVRGIASKSAIAAGYASSSVWYSSSILLRDPGIRAAIQAFLKELDHTADEVLREIENLAFSDMRQVAEWGPGGVDIRRSDEITDAAAAAVETVSETTLRFEGKGDKPGIERTTVKVKLHSKLDALKELAKFHKIVQDEEQSKAAATTTLNHPIFNFNVDLRRLSEDQLGALEQRLTEMDSFLRTIGVDIPPAVLPPGKGGASGAKNVRAALPPSDAETSGAPTEEPRDLDA